MRRRRLPARPSPYVAVRSCIEYAPKDSTMKKDTSLDVLNAADELGYEARSATGDHAALKLWLRL